MSDCDCCDENEEDSEEEIEKFKVEGGAGWLFAEAEAESPDEAVEKWEEMWDKMMDDVKDLTEAERLQAGIKQ